jgi:hypothetical protein
VNPRISLRHVVARLVAGPLYQEETDLWNRLLIEEENVRAHYRTMGLEVVVDPESGYAFLKQEEGADADGGDWQESGEAPLPRLLRRTPLSYHQTLLLVLLRERLLQHEQSPDSEAFLYLDDEALMDLLRPYYGETHNEKKLNERAARVITRLVELGILRKLKNRSDSIYRVEPIIKAKLPAEQIKEVRDRLAGIDAELNEEETEDEPAAID